MMSKTTKSVPEVESSGVVRRMYTKNTISAISPAMFQTNTRPNPGNFILDESVMDNQLFSVRASRVQTCNRENGCPMNVTKPPTMTAKRV
jgi:hypothetical protein